MMLKLLCCFLFATAVVSADQSINNYIKATLENLKLQMPHGIPQLGIPPLDPFGVPNQNINIKEGVANVNIKLTDTKINGLSKFSVSDITSNMQNLQLGLKLTLTEIAAMGQYDLDGKVLIFPLYGKGRAALRVRGLGIKGHAALTATPQGYLQLQNFVISEVLFNDANLILENILGGGNLGNVINTLLNSMAKPIFDRFSPVITKELSGVIRKELNKELGKVKLQDIINGAMPSFFGVTVKRRRRDAGNANTYLDQVLANARSEISRNNLDPLKLPDQREGFSKKILWVTVHGEAKLYNGYLRGLSTLRRTGNAGLASEGNNLVMAANIGLQGIGAGYTGHAKFQGLGPSISGHATLSHANVYIKVSQDLTDSNASPVLREFSITSLGGIDCRINGLGPLGWILGKLVALITNVVKHEIKKAVEGPIRGILASELAKVKLPM